MKEELRRAGLKVTLPRLNVLRIMQESEKRHLSAESIYRRLLEKEDTVGLATVYRVLTQLESAGVVEGHLFDEGHMVYELAQDNHHDHMVDLDTGEIIEFSNDTIEALQHDIATQHGKQLIDHQLVLYVRQAKAD